MTCSMKGRLEYHKFISMTSWIIHKQTSIKYLYSSQVSSTLLGPEYWYLVLCFHCFFLGVLKVNVYYIVSLWWDLFDATPIAHNSAV